MFVPHVLKNVVAFCHQFYINIFTGNLSVDNVVRYEHNRVKTKKTAKAYVHKCEVQTT